MLNNTDAETVGKLFEDAIQLEKATEALYAQLASIFGDYPEVSKFWKHYADEERGHASYLERIRAVVEVGRLSNPADGAIFEKVQYCLETASQKRLEKIVNLDDAYRLAIELENSETNAIFEFMLVNFSTDELAKSHQFLRIQLSNHVAKLENEFPSQYRSQAARQNVLVAR